MLETLTEFWTLRGLDEPTASRLADITALLAILLIGLLAYLLVRYGILRLLAHAIRHNRFHWDNFLLERKVFHRLAHFIPALLLHAAAPMFPDWQEPIRRVASVYMILAGVSAAAALLSAIDDIYRTHDVSKVRPIKGYLQGLAIFFYIIAGVLVLSTIMGESPVILLSGIGAMTAILMLIFKDSILGLVAGIQLSANDMVRIGDWIEMPKYNADGDVVDITLTTVKVANFDRTITTIPPYALITDSFRNWRGMVEAGGRRIKRAIMIDTASVGFCSDELLERFRRIQLLQGYVEARSAEIEAYNREHGVDGTEPVNGRRMTNLGTFRIYIEEYLRHHPDVHPDMIRMVRQLPPGEHGLPLELYLFTRTTDWIEYERIQADLFDHLLAVAPRFGLRVYQAPSGADLRAGLGKDAS